MSDVLVGVVGWNQDHKTREEWKGASRRSWVSGDCVWRVGKGREEGEAEV